MILSDALRGPEAVWTQWNIAIILHRGWYIYRGSEWGSRQVNPITQDRPNQHRSMFEVAGFSSIDQIGDLIRQGRRSSAAERCRRLIADYPDFSPGWATCVPCLPERRRAGASLAVCGAGSAVGRRDCRITSAKGGMP